MERIVFTDDWQEQIKTKYSGLLDRDKPKLYFIATDARFQSIRDEIEQWIEMIPHAKRKRLIASLRSPESFQESYNELVVGHVLRQFGIPIEYERQFGNLTPDWYVQSTSKSSAFIVEAFTNNVSEDRQSEDQQLYNLLARINEIQFDGVLSISWNYPQDSPQSSWKPKQIVSDLKKWLASSIEIGQSILIENLLFEVSLKDIGIKKLKTIGPSTSFYVNTEPLVEKIKKKVSKYKSLSIENNLPLVIAFMPTFESGIGWDSFFNVVVGRERFEIQFDSDTGQAKNTQRIRPHDGLLSTIPALGGVLMVDRNTENEWSGRMILKKEVYEKVSNGFAPGSALGELDNEI